MTSINYRGDYSAAGNVGSRVVAEALSRGHEVTAVMRDPARLHELHPAASGRVGDASKIDDVIKLSADQDLVITATRPPVGSESGLAQTGVRLLAVGGAGGLTVPDNPDTLVVDDSRYVSPAWRDIALACVNQLEVYRGENQVDWTYLSPAAQLMPGERTGIFRLGKDELLVDAEGSSKISMEDLAIALMDEAEHAEHA